VIEIILGIPIGLCCVALASRITTRRWTLLFRNALGRDLPS
jgi:hypothetical protein